MKNLKLYAVTCNRSDISYEKQCKEAILGGVDIIQLRSGNMTDKELIISGERIRKIANTYKIPFIINNRIDIALIVGADGVHLGQDDISVSKVKGLIRCREIYLKDKRKTKSFIIGVSTHDLKQAVKAQKDGADYISVGPIFSTPTKPEYKSVGINLIRQVKKKIKIPFVAIGGINIDNMEVVINAGARNIAVVREICGVKNIKQSAREMKRRLQEILKDEKKVDRQVHY